MVDSTGTTTWAYDVLGRVTSVAQPCGAVNKTVSYSYDANANRLTMTDPDGVVQSYVYDADNRLTSTTAPNAGTTSYQYDALGRVTRQDNGNGTYTLNTFDTAGNLTLLENHKSDGTMLSSFAYTLDNVGNRLSITEHVLNTDNSTYDDATVNYTYDNIYRLTSEHRTGAHPFWNEYVYDNAGNRLTLTQKDDAGTVIGTTNSVYDAANKLQSSGNISYTWDANGNMVAKTVGGVTQTMVWDYEDKMTQLHDGTTMNFTTDSDGFRRSLSSGGSTIYFVYDRRSNTPGIDPLITETDASGTTTTRYTNANGIVSQTRSGTVHWYAYEAIGSTRQLTDSTGAVTDTYAYQAFGTTAAAAGTTPNPFKYVGDYGYYDDGQSGMMLLGVRWYDENSSIFLSRDPIQYDLRWYGYSSNCPAGRIDPTGLAHTVTLTVTISSLWGCDAVAYVSVDDCGVSLIGGRLRGACRIGPDLFGHHFGAGIVDEKFFGLPDDKKCKCVKHIDNECGAPIDLILPGLHKRIEVIVSYGTIMAGGLWVSYTAQSMGFVGQDKDCCC